MWTLAHPPPHPDTSFWGPMKNAQLEIFSAGDCLFLHFIVCLRKGCCFLREKQHIAQIVFVVTRTKHRANKFITEKVFLSRALKIAMELLKQPALLKMRAIA